MSSDYPGDPTADQPPSFPPGPGEVGIVTIPSDGDPLAAASVAQAMKVPVDQLAFWNSNLVGIYRETFQFLTENIVSDKTPIDNYAIASVIMTGGGQLNLGAIATGFGGQYANFVTTANTDYVFFSTRTAIVPFAGINSSLVACCEFFANFRGNTNMHSIMGFVDNPDPASLSGGAYVELTSMGYFLEPVDVALDVAPVTNTWNNIKIQCFGGATPQGVANGAAYTRVLLNGVEVAKENNYPIQNCYFAAGVEAFGTTPSEAWLGPLMVSWTLI